MKNNKFLIIIVLFLFTFLKFIVLNFVNFSFLGKSWIFLTMFMTIVLEALPFLLIGAIFSSLIEVYVSKERISGIIPKNRVLAISVAALIGIILPIHESGIILVVRRLIKKGIPPYVGLTMILAVPIINFVVASSTYFALFPRSEFTFYRLSFGFLIAFIIGLSISFWKKDSTKKILRKNYELHSDKKMPLFFHIENEFFEIGKFLIIGAIIASSINILIPRSSLMSVGQDTILSIPLMMLFTFSLSLCSDADAFVVRPFLTTFTSSSILSFLVFGSMIDLRSTIMLLGTFNKGFVVKFIITLTIISLIIFYLSSLLI